MSSRRSSVPQNLLGQDLCAAGERESTSAYTHVHDFHSDYPFQDNLKVPVQLKVKLVLYMRSTGSLRVSRCLMPSPCFAPRNQKRSELFQKSTTKLHVWSAPMQTHHQNNNVAHAMEGSFLEFISSLSCGSCEYLRRCEYPKKTPTWKPDVAQTQKKRHRRTMGLL